MELTEINYETPKPKAKTQLNLGSIQSLRAIAALMVAFAHLHAVENKLGGPIIFGQWSLSGFAGVDVFFAISGFIMVWTNRKTQSNLVSIIRFWFLRLMRIYPIWLLICGAIYGVYITHPDWVYQSHHSQPDILKSFLLLPQNSLPLHAVGWTLVHELWFYIVFGILLFLPRKFMIVGLSLWATILILCMAIGFTTNSAELKLITNPLGLEFISGAVCALFVGKVPAKYAKQILIMGLLFAIAGLIGAAPIANDFFARTNDRVLWFAIPCALIILGLVKLEQTGWNAPTNLSRLGDYSYALYLIHVPVFALMGRMLARFSNPNSIIDNFAFCVISLSVAIFSSAILHLLFERPIMRLTHKLTRPKAIN